jgi:hypothetical protein
MQEFRADAIVEPDTARHILHISTDLFRQIRDLVAIREPSQGVLIVGVEVNVERSQSDLYRERKLSRNFRLFNRHDGVGRKSAWPIPLGLSSNPKRPAA